MNNTSHTTYTVGIVILGALVILMFLLYTSCLLEDEARVDPGELVEQTITCYDEEGDKAFQATGLVMFDLVAGTVTVKYETRETLYYLNGGHCDVE